MARMHVTGANMFRPKADANHARGQAPQNWKFAEEAKYKR